MKKLYSVFFSLVLAASLFTVASTTATAQKYSFDPGKTVKATWNGDGYMDMNLNINNLTNSDLEIKWRRISNEFPSSWDYSICDNGNCYSGIPEGATFSPVAADSKAFLKLTVGPTALSPTGRVTFGISEVGSSVEDTVTFIVESVTSVSEELAQQIQLSPNPVNDILSFQIPASISSVKVINALGEVVAEKSAMNTTFHIDFSALASGTYMVVLTDNNLNAVVRKVQKY